PGTPPGLMFSQQALLSACPAVGPDDGGSLAARAIPHKRELPATRYPSPPLTAGLAAHPVNDLRAYPGRFQNPPTRRRANGLARQALGMSPTAGLPGVSKWRYRSGLAPGV